MMLAISLHHPMRRAMPRTETINRMLETSTRTALSVRSITPPAEASAKVQTGPDLHRYPYHKPVILIPRKCLTCQGEKLGLKIREIGVLKYAYVRESCSTNGAFSNRQSSYWKCAFGFV